MLKTKHYTYLLASYCGLIFYLSHQPAIPVPHMFEQQDKLIHGLAYAVMGLLAYFSFKLEHRGAKLIVPILFCSFYGVTDEFHQSFIEGRVADVWDWLADTAGATAAVVALYTQERLKK